jgi:molybdopterin-guanine dinucleotide biosynthesis protein A
MGEDKGSLIYGSAAVPQVRAAWELLRLTCGQAWVSVNEDQLHESVYADLPTIVDTNPDRGPAGGLLSAFEANPDTAWLVLAVDMPRVSPGVLQNLIEQRDRNRIATVHCHADGTLEPLCAIWEATSQAFIAEELAHGRASLRAVAQRNSAAIARLPQPERLQNANTPAERRILQHSLDQENDESGEAGRDGP